VPGKSTERRRRRDALAKPPSNQASIQTSDGKLYRVGRVTAVKRGESMKFIMPIRGFDEECFVVNYHGVLYAYVNRCRHIPMPLDWVDNEFFAERGRYLMCQTHNAYYEPQTGECIAGPRSACGKSLYRVPLTLKDGGIYVSEPVEEFEDE
jgi:nitrite reductase/ring-hydroxylating ferredoxin subunit